MGRVLLWNIVSAQTVYEFIFRKVRALPSVSNAACPHLNYCYRKHKKKKNRIVLL